MLASVINRSVRGIQLPTDVALLFDLRTDWRVLTFTLLLSVATGLLFSLIPALQSSKPQLVPSLKDESSMAGFRRSRLRNSLVVAQVSLSLVLLISAGLIVRSLQAAQRMRPGFNPEMRSPSPSMSPCTDTTKRVAAPSSNKCWNAPGPCRRSRAPP